MKRSAAHEALDKVRAFDRELGRLVHLADEQDSRRHVTLSCASASSAAKQQEALGGQVGDGSQRRRKAATHGE